MSKPRILEAGPARLRYILLPLLGWVAYAVRAWWDALKRLVLGTLRLETRALAEGVLGYLVARSRVVPLGTRPIHPEFVHGVSGANLRARALRLREVLSKDGTLLLVRGWIPVVASLEDDYESVDDFGSLLLRYPRGFLDFEEILVEVGGEILAASEAREAADSPVRVRVVSAGTRYNEGGGREGASEEEDLPPGLKECFIGDPELRAAAAARAGTELGDLYLPGPQEACVADLEDWIASRRWYEAHRVPWRRGYLFHGPPGTGKTSFALALAHRFRFEVLKFDLAAMTNKWLRARWREHTREGAKLILLEDFDVIFEGRKNVAADGDAAPLTFDCVLAMLDGTHGGEGCVVVMTTNRPEVLDPALASRAGNGKYRGRPGRIDRAVFFGYLEPAGRRALAARFLGDRLHLVEDLIESREPVTAAEFQEACILRVLEAREAASTDPGPPPALGPEEPPAAPSPRTP